MPRTLSVKAAWPLLISPATIFLWVEPVEGEPLRSITADLIRLGFLALADYTRGAVSTFRGDSFVGLECHANPPRPSDISRRRPPS